MSSWKASEADHEIFEAFIRSNDKRLIEIEIAAEHQPQHEEE